MKPGSLDEQSILRLKKKKSTRLRLPVQQEGMSIGQKESSILLSAEDKQIFFAALMGHETPPNDALISAIAYYKDHVTRT